MSYPTMQVDLGHLSPALAGAVPAPTGRRVASYFVTWVPVIILLTVSYAALTGYILNPDSGGLLALSFVVTFLALAYELTIAIMFVRSGQTPGHRALGIRVVQEETGDKLTFGNAFLRYLIFQVSGAAVIGPLVLVLSILWDNPKYNRGWHDKAVKAVLIDLRSGRDTWLQKPVMTTGMAAPQDASGAYLSAVAVQDAAPIGGYGAADSYATGSATPPPPPPPPPSLVTPALPMPAAPALASPAPASPAPAPLVPGTPTPASAYLAAPVSAPPAVGGVISAVPGLASPTPATPPPPPPPAPAPARAQAPAPAPAEEDELDRTFLAAPRKAGVAITFDAGTVLPVEGRGLVGRNPQDDGAGGLAHLVPLADAEMSISKTHLEFGLDGATFWVRDLHSTNGVSVNDSRGVTALIPGEVTVVAPGSTVEFGNRSFVVRTT